MPASYRSPWMTEELDLLRATARRFFEEEVAPHAARFRAQHHIDRESGCGPVSWGCCA